MKISVVINTYNAELYLDEVLQSVKDFDEIVICDMESTDSTVSIAKKYNCKIVTFPRREYRIVEPARNFAIQSASNDWVLVVDADEIVTKQLKDYLYKRITQTSCPKGIFIPRKNKFMGRYLGNHVGDWQLRFFAKQYVFWPETIHSIPKVDGKVERISKKEKNAKLIHLEQEYLHDRLEKINRYTDNELLRRKDKHYGFGSLVFSPMAVFFKSYFLQQGFRYGKCGFIKAISDSTYKFFTISKVIENKMKSHNSTAQSYE